MQQQLNFSALLASHPFVTPAMRAMVARVLQNRELATLEKQARRPPRPPRVREPMDQAARARVERARCFLGPYLLRERNRLAKARERARRLAEDPEGYRRGRREEMREWRAKTVPVCTSQSPSAEVPEMRYPAQRNVAVCGVSQDCSACSPCAGLHL